MIAPYYVSLYLAMEKTANRYGYCLALHGTLNRDLDVVAIPWTAQAYACTRLIAAFKKQHKEIIHISGAASKPHGRQAFVFLLGGDAYIDLSVMPLASEGKKK